MARTRATAGVADEQFAKTIAAVYGVVFLLVGVAGFIPGITTNYDDLRFAGHESNAMVLGVFEVSVLHNIVHLAFGVVGLAMARRAIWAAYYLAGGGFLYAVVWLYGVMVDRQSEANFLPLNNADNWLHLILAVTMLGLGAFALQRLRKAPASRMV